MAMLKVKDLEKFQGETTLQVAWIASYRNFLLRCEPIVLERELQEAIDYADRVVDSLKKCR